MPYQWFSTLGMCQHQLESLFKQIAGPSAGVWFSSPGVGSENWPNRFLCCWLPPQDRPGLSVLTQHSRERASQTLRLDTPRQAQSWVFSEHPSSETGKPCHKANPRGPPSPEAGEWLQVSMGPCWPVRGKGKPAEAAPEKAQDAGSQAASGWPSGRQQGCEVAALLQSWGLLGSRQASPTGRKGLADTHLLRTPIQNHPASQLLLRWHNSFFIVWAGSDRAFCYLTLKIADQKAKQANRTARPSQDQRWPLSTQYSSMWQIFQVISKIMWMNVSGWATLRVKLKKEPNSGILLKSQLWVLLTRAMLFFFSGVC